MFKFFQIKNLIYLLFFITSSSSQSYWVRYGWQLYENAGDARILSMGSAAVTDYGTTTSSLFNPASSGYSSMHNINYTHQSRLGGMINSDLIGFPLTGYSRPLNLIILYEGIDQIPDTRNILLDFGLDGIPGTGDIGEGNGLLDEGERLDGNKLTYFSQKQTGIHISTAWDRESYKFGIGIKSLYHTLGEFSSTGIGLDLGLISHPWQNGRVGILIRDFTTSWQVWNNGTIERFKPTIVTGFSHNYFFEKMKINAKGNADFVWDTNGINKSSSSINKNNTYALLGLSIIYDNIVAIRFGRNKIKSTTMGVGLSWKDISLDYAFLNEPQNSGLGSTHLISLSINSDLILEYIDKL